MGSSSSREKGKASSDIRPDGKDGRSNNQSNIKKENAFDNTIHECTKNDNPSNNMGYNESISCYMNYDKANNDNLSNTNNDDKTYNYASIDLNLSNQENMALKTNSKDRKLIINEFINKYDLHYEEKKKNIEQKTAELQDHQAIRSNIRVLIIVASISDCYTLKSLNETGDFFENAEDFTIAFLICHLFHYAFLIPYSQILITSTEEDSFTIQRRR